MMEPTKKLPARFYRTSQGNEPVREWLKSLTPAERQVIGKDMQRVEFGWPLGLPVCRSLGNGLWEVRSDLPSRRTARVIFCIIAGQMILLHGFIKKTPQTPRRDLDLAQVRKAEVEQSGEETQP
jgi:phage-related protein